MPNGRVIFMLVVNAVVLACASVAPCGGLHSGEVDCGTAMVTFLADNVSCDGTPRDFFFEDKIFEAQQMVTYDLPVRQIEAGQFRHLGFDVVSMSAAFKKFFWPVRDDIWRTRHVPETVWMNRTLFLPVVEDFLQEQYDFPIKVLPGMRNYLRSSEHSQISSVNFQEGSANSVSSIMHNDGMPVDAHDSFWSRLHEVPEESIVDVVNAWLPLNTDSLVDFNLGFINTNNVSLPACPNYCNRGQKRLLNPNQMMKYDPQLAREVFAKPDLKFGDVVVFRAYGRSTPMHGMIRTAGAPDGFVRLSMDHRFTVVRANATTGKDTRISFLGRPDVSKILEAK